MAQEGSRSPVMLTYIPRSGSHPVCIWDYLKVYQPFVISER